ncbi:GNAT family N-acetyltransferase [Tichowtungia aerotolerans]|uniref:GNAT family N-acetyltransferase n=1 Tax=Tichowtungia aerotolerans TaxID=2697043 RepID=A0A6P1M1D7_9BACT|nr:GNAT family N-acetyltransferase [Tichowtungia aerotolerans]QHI67912.1 GNAT family N-acetyltransferase [Tichowtungia aerotolerans]
MTCLEPSILGNFSKLQRYLAFKKHQILPRRHCSAINLKIRQINETDTSAIKDLVRSSYGRTLAEELEDQNRGLTSIIVAWVDTIPCGYSFVSWKGPRDPEVRSKLPNIPEFYCLTVIEPFRCRGIGTALIDFMEKTARNQGFTQMGLGVAHTNLRAHTLYQHLGYKEAIEEYYDRYPCLDETGHPKEAADLCRFMVKNLD